MWLQMQLSLVPRAFFKFPYKCQEGCMWHWHCVVAALSLSQDDSGHPSDFVTCLLEQSIASSREFAQQVSKLLEGRR